MINTLTMFYRRFVAWISWCLSCMARSLGLHLIPRQHKHKVHGALLGIIAWDLIHAGFKVADLGFLALSLLMEAEDSTHHTDPNPPAGVHLFTLDPTIATSGFHVDHAEELSDRLQAYLLTQGIKVRSWTQLPAWIDQDVKAAAVTWIDDKDRVTRSIAIRPNMDPSIYLYLLLHEASHALGRVSGEQYAIMTRAVKDPPMPCWLNGASMITAGIAKAFSQAAETEAEHTVRAVAVLRGWDTVISDRYLRNWKGSTLPPCLVPTVTELAARLNTVLEGDSYVTQL